MATYHGITAYACEACGWTTTDDYELEVVNDWTGACLHCDTEAKRSAFTITEGS